MTGAEVCLPEGISEAKRLYVLNATNQQSAIQIKSFPWRLAIASNLVAEIIISEVLGYHASVEVVSPIFTDAIESFGCSTDCETNHGTDILFEVWLTEVAQFFADFQSENPQVVEDLGSMGYEASSGMYMKGSVREHAESDSGLPLEYYKSYNLSLNQPYRYFDTIWDLNASELLACTAQHSDLMNPSKMKNFLDWTGDVEGVVETNGQYSGHCPVHPSTNFLDCSCLPAQLYPLHPIHSRNGMGGNWHAMVSSLWNLGCASILP